MIKSIEKVNKNELLGIQDSQVIELEKLFSSDDFSSYGRKESRTVYEYVSTVFPSLDGITPPSVWIDFCALMYEFFTGEKLSGLKGSAAECKETASNLVLNEIKKLAKNEEPLNLREKLTTPTVTASKEYKVYKDPLHKESKQKDLWPISVSEKTGKIEYGCGLTLNFGNGNMKKFNIGLTSPATWENKNEVLKAVKGFCDDCLRDEYSYVNEKDRKGFDDIFKVNEKLEQIAFTKTEKDKIFLFQFGAQRVIDMENFENSRYYLYIESYCNIDEIRDFRYSVVNWVNDKLSDFEKEAAPRIKKYKEQRSKQTNK